MRVKGKIVSWNDDKGYGFVVPCSGKRQIFIHISDFENLSRQPETDHVVSYIVSTDKQGRPCGKSVLLNGDRLPKNRNRKTGLFSFVIVVSFVVFAVQSFYFGKIPFWVLVLYMFVSLITFIAYAIDKSAAKNGRWRTQESTLHLFSLLGGWPGAIVAQQKIRHKSKKQEFRFVFWTTVLVNIGIFAWFHTPDGAANLQVVIWKFQSFIASIDGLEDMNAWLWKLGSFFSSIKYSAND